MLKYDPSERISAKSALEHVLITFIIYQLFV